ncbi:MAG: DUF262 domain-containing protein [Eggerthellaceae bacterium]|nr:DUF262 domain-containing protein [Eggerthellaceae bacterium]
MQTTNEQLLDLLGQPHTQFVIPAYQRAYSWGERECRELWLDLHRAARAGANHFMGTFLYAEDKPVGNAGEEAAGSRRLAIVDGQQRLTTLTLVLIALSRHLKATGRHVSCATGGEATSISAESISERYLFANAQDVKLTLSRNDRDTLRAIVRNEALPANAPKNLTHNLAFFEGLMAEPDFDANQLWAGLTHLAVIAAQVQQDDPAQLIFESLNSKGLPLTTADLVRNYLLLAESHEEQTRLYDQYWQTIEGVFQPDPGSLRLDNGIQGWLSVRFRKVRAKGTGEVYGVFKQYVEDEFTGTTESLLRELRNFCLVWAENYRYHAVKKYKSAGGWAVGGAATLTAGYEKKPASNQALADRMRRDLNATDASL